MLNKSSSKKSVSTTELKEIFATGLKLCIFMSVICVMLFFVNSITSEKIAEFESKKINDAIITIMGDDPNMTIEPLEDLGDSSIKEVYKIDSMVDEQSQLIGYCVYAKAKGYGGEFNLLVGLNADGTVKGISVISDSETVGIGKKVLTDSFLSKFNGKSEGVTLGSGDIVAVSGATVTSKAVTSCVNSVLDFYESTLKEADTDENNG
ncbi:MAG: FMN-binding protein [Clostridia bacterium]|nr:FMN-binding protein [Clostridia bacterium]